MTSGPPNGSDLLARIPDDWRRPTLEIAEALQGAGHRAWIVGGGVRDLVLGRPIKDIDLVSAARPEEVEGLFEKTIAVGKSFGIVVVVIQGRELEVATFRRERGYSDRRRPDEIEFADSPEVDAGRRDFTCNALYLDPLDGEIVDPAGGLPDLTARTLRAVGDPAARFREDGLRLLRMARFAAGLGLDPAPGLVDAARSQASSIEGVSPERVFDELGKILSGARAALALELLESSGVAGRCLPGWTAEHASERIEVLDRLERQGLAGSSAVERGLVPVLCPWPLLPNRGGLEADPGSRGATIVERLTALRASKELREAARHRLVMALSIASGAWAAPDEEGRGSGTAEARGRLAELALDGAFEDGLGLALAATALRAARELGPALEAFAARARRCATEAPDPPYRLPTDELIAAGWAPGPALGGVLTRLRHAALGGAFQDRAGALAWLSQHVT